MKRILSLVVMILLVSAGLSDAQDISRVGTAAAQFLKLGVGAQAAALGEAAVTIPGHVFGLYWNPASIASIDRSSLGVSRNNLYADMAYSFVGFVQPLGGSSAIGISAVFFDSDDIEITTLSQPEGTGTNFSWEAYAIGISYSRFVTDRLSLGATIKYIREGAYQLYAQNLALDLGSLLNTGVLGLKLGMCLSNFGGEMSLTGPKLLVTHNRWPNNPGAVSSDANLKTEKYPMPLTFRIGLSTQLIGNEGQLATSNSNTITISADAYDPNDALMRSNFGIEYVWNNILSLRAGYRGLSVEKDKYDSYHTASFAFGGGLKYDFGFARIAVDYAYTDFKILGTGQLVSMVVSF